MQEELIELVKQNPSIAEPLLELLRLIREHPTHDPSELEQGSQHRSLQDDSLSTGGVSSGYQNRRYEK